MIGALLEALVGSLVAGGGRRRRSVPRPVPLPVARPEWWKGLAVALLLVQQVPLAIGAVWLLVVSFQVGSDDLLMFVGLIAVCVASVVATMAMVVAGWAVTVAIRVLQDHGHARWYVGAFGLGGTIAAAPLLGGGLAHPLLVLFVTASLGLVVTAVGAPPDEGPSV